MLTIGQVAKYAGVTIRAVRHYHQRGLLPEPERDASGYRRYDAQAAIDLVKIRTLSEAGVPLARVRELMGADADQFAEAMTEIDAHLRDEIKRLQRNRKAIAQLAGGEDLALPAYVVEYLEKMRRLGIGEQAILAERESWLVLAAHTPEQAAIWVADKSRWLDDEPYAEIYRLVASTATWAADDPRLPEVATRLAEFLREFEAPESHTDLDPGLVGLVDEISAKAAPTWQVLGELLSQRTEKSG